MFGFGSIPKGKTKCQNCNGNKRETYYEDVPRGGADSRVDRVQNTRPCRVCNEVGWL